MKNPFKNHWYVSEESIIRDRIKDIKISLAKMYDTNNGYSVIFTRRDVVESVLFFHVTRHILYIETHCFHKINKTFDK